MLKFKDKALNHCILLKNSNLIFFVETILVFITFFNNVKMITVDISEMKGT